MKIFLYLIIVISIAIVLVRSLRKKNIIQKKQTPGIAHWMKMSRQERNEYDEQQKRETLDRKRMLLNQIRKEYKNLSKPDEN